MSSNASLLDEPTAYGDHVIRKGDCLAPRTVEEAVLKGLQAAWNQADVVIVGGDITGKANGANHVARPVGTTMFDQHVMLKTRGRGRRHRTEDLQPLLVHGADE